MANPPIPDDPAARDSDGATEEDRREAGPEAREDRAGRTPFTQQLGRILVIAIAVLFGIFAVINAQYVEFHWVFGGTEVTERGGERVSGGVPLIILLVVSFVLGALAGWFATWWRGRDRHGS